MNVMRKLLKKQINNQLSTLRPQIVFDSTSGRLSVGYLPVMMKVLGSTFVILLAAVIARCNEYVVNPANGIGYRLVYQAKVWSKAKEVCEQEGAKLAVPKSEEEFRYIQSLVHGMYYPNITGTDFKLLVYLGINNLENYKVWKNVDGENIENTGYHTWAGRNGQGYSADPAEPHCVGIDAANPGLRDWWCHLPQPYVCQRDNTTRTSAAN